MIILIGDNAPVTPENMHRFVIRFDGGTPSLYLDGKRLVVGWKLVAENVVVLHVESTTEEANANTAS